jgi:hypothetical protein
METNQREDMHAGELETSILLATYSDVVRPGYETADWRADHRPYLLLTKGETLAACHNRQLLARLATNSVSCAHPETPRWRDRPQGNCGYCLPCLVRRAALARIRRDDAVHYAWDALTDAALLDPAERTGADLRALVHGVSPHRDELAIIRNAPLPSGEHESHLRLWRRGAEEIRTWLGAADGPLARFTATAWRNQ